MKKIKVLHVAQSAGGVDRYLQMLLKYVDKDKFENIVVFSQDFRREDYEAIASSYEQVEMQRAIGKCDLKAAIKIRKLIRKYKPDIVYAHSSKAGAVTRIAEIGIRNHCIYNPHGWAFNMLGSKKKQFLHRVIERVAAPFCEKIVCISEAEKETALKNRICIVHKLQVIFNGIDIEAYEHGKHGEVSKADLGIPVDAFVVGMVGRMSPQKAPDVFVKAAALIKKDIPSAHFIIVGNGPQEEEIKKYATQNGLKDCLHITGWVDNPLSYVELFNTAVLLSRWEGFGLALPEYMMVGKPIVASRVDAIPDIIRHSENGLLVEPDNEYEAYEAIMRLYKNPMLREKLIKQGKEEVRRRFDAKRVAKEHEILWEGLLKK